MDRAILEEKFRDARRLLFLALKTLKELESLHREEYAGQLSLPLAQTKRGRRKRR